MKNAKSKSKSTGVPHTEMPKLPRKVRTTPAAVVREEQAKPLRKYGDMTFDKKTGEPVKFCYSEYDEKTRTPVEKIVDLKKK